MRFDCSDPAQLMMAIDTAVQTDKCPECHNPLVWTEEADGDWLDTMGECPRCKWSCAFGGLQDAS